MVLKSENLGLRQKYSRYMRMTFPKKVKNGGNNERCDEETGLSFYLSFTRFCCTARPLRLAFADALYLVTADRDSAIAAAYASGGHSMQAIGDYFGLHYSRINMIVLNVERAKRKILFFFFLLICKFLQAT